MRFPAILCFYKPNMLVSRGAADVAVPHKFEHIHLPSFAGG